MKKFFVICMLCILLVGCGKETENNILDNENIKENTKVNNITESYTKYTELKSKAYDKLNEAIGEGENYNFTLAMGMLGFASMDLSLIPITVCGLDKEAAMAGLAFLYSNIDYKSNKDGCKVTFNVKDGEKMTYDIIYDEKTDSLKTKVYSEDQLSIVSEYVKLKSGYATQFYSVEETETYVFKSIFDENKIVVGKTTVSAEPESIFKNANAVNEEWTKSTELWSKYENGQTTSIVDGEEF